MIVAYLGDRCYYYLLSFVLGVDGLGGFVCLFVVSSNQSIVLIGLVVC